MKAARILLFAALACATARAAPTSRLAVEWYVPLDSNAGKFALVDTAGGTVRIGTMTADGKVAFPQVVPTGITDVSDAASGITGANGEEVFLTSPLSNRIIRLSADSTAPFASLFSPITGIGPSGIGEFGATTARDLIIGSILNPSAAPGVLEIRSQSGVLAVSEANATLNQRLEPMTDPTSGNRIGIGISVDSSNTNVFTVEPKKAGKGVKLTNGNFGIITDVRGSAGARHIIGFRAQTNVARIITVSQPVSITSTLTQASTTFPFNVGALIPVPAASTSPLTDGFMALAADGTQAVWLRVNAAGTAFITTPRTFTADPGSALTGLLPMAGGVVQLSGTEAGSISSSFKGLKFDGTNWNVTSSGNLPGLPTAAQAAATLLFFDKDPNTSTNSRLLGVQTAPDWTRRTDLTNPVPTTVAREAFISATSGLRFSTTQTLALPPGTGFVMTNQADPALSIATLGDATVQFSPALEIKPASGVYDHSFQVTASFDAQRYVLKFRRDATGAWLDFPGALPVAYSTQIQFSLQTLGSSTLGPIQSRSYQISTNSLKGQDSDGDGVPDFVELFKGLDPFGGADSDNDGISDLDEILERNKSNAVPRGAGFRIAATAFDHANRELDADIDGLSELNPVTNQDKNPDTGEQLSAHGLDGILLTRAESQILAQKLPDNTARAALLESQNPIPTNELIGLYTPRQFLTPPIAQTGTEALNGRETIRFVSADPPPKLNVAVNPLGVSLTTDAEAWINAAKVAAANIPFATTRTRLDPVDNAVSVLLEHLVYLALYPPGTPHPQAPALDKFSLFAARESDTALVSLTSGDKNRLLTAGYDFRMALKIAQSSLLPTDKSQTATEVRNATTAVAVGVYQAHVTEDASQTGFNLPIDALRIILRGGDPPSGYKTAAITAQLGIARSAYETAVSQAKTAFRPQETWTLEIPVDPLGVAVYSRIFPAAEPEPVALFRNGARFLLEQGLGLQPGTRFAVTGYTDLPDDAGLAVLDVISASFLSSPVINDRDSDSNGLDDEWERFFFGAIGQNPGFIPPGKTQTLAQIFANGGDPRGDSTGPEIVVEQPAGTNLADAGARDFGIIGVGSAVSRVFTIKNIGNADLTGLGISFDGADAGSFSITGDPTAPVTPGGSTTFTVRFLPTSAGAKTAALHLTSNDADEDPFDITLTGTAVSVGNVHPTFNPNVFTANVIALAVQPDGKILIGGGFNTVGGQAAGNLARVNADGTLDTSFAIGTGANNSVVCLAVQTDGKILVGGNFISFNGQTVGRIVRLNPDGSIDTGFTPGAGFTGGIGTVAGMALQPDGKIVVVGQFSNAAGQARNRLARLNEDGTLDASFNPGTGADNNVRVAAVQPDGQILIAGDFITINGQPRNRIARLNADGSLESTATFNVGTGASSNIRSLMLLPDGKIALAGDFSSINGVSRFNFARLNSNGSLDSFNVPGINGSIASMARQTDGKFFIAGSFSNIGGQSRNRIARINADGTVDTSFAVGTGIANQVNCLAQTSNGSVLVGGLFSAVNGVSRSGIAMLVNSAPSVSITAPDRTQIQWARTGTAPTITTATFDLSTDAGVTWTPLGFSTFVTGGWSMTELNLPDSGLIRTRGRISSGQSNASSGIIEAVAAFNISNVSVPTISDIANVTTDEDTATAAIPFTVADAGTPLNSLVVSATSSDTTLLPLSGIGIAGADGSRSITLTPAPNRNGTATVTVSVSDGFTTSSDSFTLTVNAVNDAPTITDIASQTILANTATPLLSFGINDAESAAASLVVTAVSSNPVLVAASGISLAGTGSARTIRIAPILNRTGNTTITVTVSDGSASATDTFDVTVTNTAPTISAIADLTLAEDSPARTISFTVGDAETPNALTVIPIAINTTLLPLANITLSGTGSTRTLTFTPAANRSGTGSILLTVSDGISTQTETFTVTVTPVNDIPTISAIADVTVLEDTASPPIPFTVFDVEGDPLTISHSALSGGIQGLVPNVVFTETPRTLTIIPNANAHGQLAFSVRVSDPSGQTGSPLIIGNSSNFNFTVTPVNDAPSFTKGQNFTHPFGFNEAQSIAGWATTTSAGPANESDQTLTFRITNSNPSLFSSAPIISSGGALSYQTNGSAGTASLTVVLEDSGGIENGGVNTSGAQTFTITVGAALPRLAVTGSGGVTLEDGNDVFDVGSSALGGSAQQTLQIKNIGQSALNLTGVTLDGTDAAQFKLTSPAFPAVLAPSASLPLLVSFSPVRSGSHVAALHISSNDSTAGTAFDLTLTGRGSLAPTVSLRPPTEITRNSLLLTAAVNAGGGDAQVTLELGTTPELGQSFPVTPTLVSGGSQVLVSSRPTGLLANTFYFYRITAENSAGAGAAEGVFLTSNVMPGSLDLPFGLNPFYDGTVKAVAVLPDGKILIGGDFVTFVDIRTDLARLNPDGTLDLTFNAQLDPAIGREVSAIAVQDDGRIVIGGNFETVGGTAQRLIARLEANGARDGSFTPTLAGNSVQRLVLGTEEQILLGGRFTSVNGSARTALARLEADGTLDAGFNPVLTGPSLNVTSLAFQNDGMLLVGGEFTGVNAVPQTKLARLSDAGALDSTFTTIVSGDVRSLLVQTDGRIVIGGAGVIVNGRGKSSIARVNSDGSTDESFATPIFTRFIAPEASIHDMAAQADGALIIAGDFFSNDTSCVARLQPDGSADRDFTVAARQAVECLAIQADGKVVLSGGFTRQNRVSSNGLVRLLNDPASESLQVVDDTQIQWLRGLAAPEVQTLDFAFSTDGGSTFTDLGAGFRIPGGWSVENSALSGLTRYHLLMEGRTISGAGNGSAGRVRTLLAHNQPDIEVTRFSDVLVDASGTLDLGSVALSQTRRVATFLIRNTGTQSLSLGQITLDGAQAAEFSVNSGKMRTSLEPGELTAFELFFTPTANGSRSAALHIASNDPDAENIFDIAFNATGSSPTPPEIGIFSPAGAELTDNLGILNLGGLETTQNHAFTFLIKNSGATPLTNLSITKTGSADFTVSQPAASNLGLNDSTLFTLNVKPAAAGARTAVIKVASNDADENPFEINVSATGTVRDIAVAVTPGGELQDARGAISFGNANPLNVPVQRTLTLRNVGTGRLTLGRVSISGVGFSISQPAKSILAPGGTDTTTCELTFLPTSGAVSRGSIQIESDDRDEAIFDIALTGGGAGAEMDVVVAGEPAPLLDGSDTVAFLPTTPGGISSRTFTLLNPSSASLRVTSLTFTNASPTGAARFTAPQINQVINPGASFNVVINFTPTALGSFAATLNIASNDPDESPFEVRLTGECLVSVQPFFTAHPQSQIVALGDPVRFTAAAGSPLAVTFQWKRGAANLANFGAVTLTPELNIPNAALADALIYSVTALNSAGSINSDQARLTVVDRAASRQSLEIKKQVVFGLKSAAPAGSRSFLWLKDGVPLAPDACITGVNTDKLTITNLNLNDSGVYVCEVSAPGGSLRGGDNTLEVFDIAPRIASSPLPLPRGQVGRTYSFQIPLDPAGGLATTYTATNLPAGLSLNAATGLITGRPLLATTSNFTLTVRNMRGASTVNAAIAVDPLPANLAGSYTGIIERNLINNMLGGRLDLTIASTAAYSGKITLGSTVITIPPGFITLPDQGSLVPVSFRFTQGSGAAAIIRRVTFTLNPLTNLISDGQVNNALPPLLVRPPRFTAWRSPWTQIQRATAFQNYHTFGLEIPAGALGNQALPQGIGFGSFTTVITGGETPITGKLADGTPFTSASILGPNGELAIFQNNAKSSLLGTLTIQPGIIFGVITDNGLNGTLSWQRPATTDRTYAAGFAQIALAASGGSYRPAPATQNLLGTSLFGLPQGLNNARISFTEGGIGGPPSVADRIFPLGAGNAIFETAGPPPFSVSTNKTVGTFTGKVTLEDPTALVQPAGRVVRDAPFEGIVVKDAQGPLGSGFFLLPQMPFINNSGTVIPVTKTPILSGAVILEPAVD